MSKPPVPFLRQALEAGINFFETANVYSGGSSEEITGRALGDMARRGEIVVATKAFFPWCNAPNTDFLSRKSLFQTVDDSLKRLGMDHVDMYLIHREGPGLSHTSGRKESVWCPPILCGARCAFALS